MHIAHGNSVDSDVLPMWKQEKGVSFNLWAYKRERGGGREGGGGLARSGSGAEKQREERKRGRRGPKAAQNALST